MSPQHVLTERNARLVAAIDGGRNAASVARELGISRERARQLYTAATGQPVPRPRPRAGWCPLCGEYFPRETPTGRSGWVQHRDAAGHPRSVLRSVERDARIIAAYQAGQSIIGIAHSTRLSATQVLRVLTRNGIPRRARRGAHWVSRPVTPAEVAQMRYLFAQGVAYTRIAVTQGRAYSTVARHLDLPYGQNRRTSAVR